MSRWSQKAHEYAARHIDLLRPCEPGDIVQAYLAGALKAYEHGLHLDHARLEAREVSAAAESDAHPLLFGSLFRSWVSPGAAICKHGNVWMLCEACDYSTAYAITHGTAVRR